MRKRMRMWDLLPALALGLAAGAGPAWSVPVTLEDGSALVEVDAAGADGLTAWTVNGVQHLRTQRLFVRVGDAGPETPAHLLDLDAQVASDTDADGKDDTLFLRWLDPQERFRLEVRFALDGTPFAPVEAGAASDLATQITLSNTSGAPLDVWLFQYTDVDLLGSFVDDAALWTPAGAANTVAVSDATGLARYESVFTRRPDAIEASVFDALLASLGDGAATALSGALSAEGDVTLGAAWSALLAPGGSLLVSQDQQVRVVPIPEPGTGVLVAGGLALGAALRRRARGRTAHEDRGTAARPGGRV